MRWLSSAQPAMPTKAGAPAPGLAARQRAARPFPVEPELNPSGYILHPRAVQQAISELVGAAPGGVTVASFAAVFVQSRLGSGGRVQGRLEVEPGRFTPSCAS